MDATSALIERRPVITFFALAYAITWVLVPPAPVSFVFPVLGLFGPALAAMLVTAVTEGGSGVKALLGRVVQWRAGWVWYVVTMGLPAALTLAVRALHRLPGGAASSGPGDPAALIAILALLVVGEAALLVLLVEGAGPGRRAAVLESVGRFGGA